MQTEANYEKAKEPLGVGLKGSSQLDRYTETRPLRLKT